MRTLLLPAEEGTRILFGRTYHWVLIGGVLHLKHGPASFELGDE